MIDVVFIIYIYIYYISQRNLIAEKTYMQNDVYD